jgi:hypothetical protein
MQAGNTSACASSILLLPRLLLTPSITLDFSKKKKIPAAMPPTSVSKIPHSNGRHSASIKPISFLFSLHFQSRIPHINTARTFPANGTFAPPQRELYAALLATQKALVKECAVSRGHSLDTLHRRSVDLLREELARVGLPCAGPVLERILYPHYLTHPIGIGELVPLSLESSRVSITYWWVSRK